MTYWFTVAKADQRKPFHQICICSMKTMQGISLKLGHRLAMVFMQSMVLNSFIKYSGHCIEHTAQCNQSRYVCRVYAKRKLQTSSPKCKGSETCSSQEKLTSKGTKFSVTIKIFAQIYYMNLIFEFYSISIVSMHQIFSTHKTQITQRSHFETPFLFNPKQKINSCN